MKPLVGPIVLVLLLAWFGQPRSPDKITEDEAREVNRVAHQFADRMQETRDIKPLIREFFVPDFISRSLRNTDEDWNECVHR